MKPHKHAELIKAWADGAEIEIYSECDDVWIGYKNGDNPSWNESYEYRIKPEQKPDVIAFFYSGNVNREMANLGANVGVVISTKSRANLILTYDGETGKLKSAEVLK